MRIRLSQKDIEIIKSSAVEVFGEHSRVYIFGSGADLSKKGGDIDIFIESDMDIDLSKELKFLALLQKQGIERKIDLVVKTTNAKYKDIFKEAKEKGVVLL
ncbi:MAG: nucleotidyltransferase domain-containing protein [Hydrogenobaculum sp.]